MLNSIIGVSDNTIETNDWFKTKPTTDSIGVIAGNLSLIHIFGLENVRECVERNNGLIYIEIGKEEFMETISIKR